MTRNDLPRMLEETLKSINGRGSIVEVCKEFWKKHENELKESGDLFYTWQYDIRWAATELRRSNILKAAEDSQKGVWVLQNNKTFL